MKKVRTFSSNANDYSMARILAGLQGWARSGVRLATESGQTDVAAKFNHVVNVATRLTDAEDTDYPTAEQPVIAKGDRFPKPEDLDALNIKLG